MKSLLTHLYDSYTGWFLLLVALIGAAAGGALAFDPAEAPVESGLTLTPTPARAAATPASISIDVPTPTAGPTALPEIGTVVAPFPQRLFRDPDGFTSAPVMGPGGAIYLSSPNRTLHAVDRLGQVIWQAELPAAPVGDLVLAATGEIVVVDRSGRLAAYTPEGELAWALPAQEGQVGVSGAVRAPDGSFYFTLESGGSGLLTAAGPDGSLRWQAPIQTTSFRTDPWVYPDGSLVFLREEAFSAETGQPAAISFPFAFDQLMTAADGTPFLQSGLTFAAIALVDGAITLPEEGLRYTIPEAGVTVRGAFLNPAGMSWISYLTESTDTLTWFNPDGTIAHQVTSSTMLISSILALDGEGTLYACALSPRMVSGGNVNDRTTYCLAYRQGEETHRWQERLASTPKTVIGSFRHDAEIFFATEDGDLYVLGRAEVAAAPTAPATPETSGAVFLDNG